MTNQYFDQQLRQLKLVEKEVRKQTFQYKEGDLKVVFRGDMQVTKLQAPGLDEAQASQLKDLLNRGLTDTQNQIMENIRRMAAEA